MYSDAFHLHLRLSRHPRLAWILDQSRETDLIAHSKHARQPIIPYGLWLDELEDSGGRWLSSRSCCECSELQICRICYGPGETRRTNTRCILSRRMLCAYSKPDVPYEPPYIRCHALYAHPVDLVTAVSALEVDHRHATAICTPYNAQSTPIYAPASLHRTNHGKLAIPLIALTPPPWHPQAKMHSPILGQRPRQQSLRHWRLRKAPRSSSGLGASTAVAATVCTAATYGGALGRAINRGSP